MASNSARSVAAVGAFAVLAAAITTVILVAGSGTPAAAADLQRFASCAEMQTWTEDVASTAFARPDVAAGAAAEGEAGGDAATAGVGAPAAATPEGASRDESATASTAADGNLAETGGTNTVVEGVDEIDIVDRLPDDRALVARNGALSLVDLSGPTLLASVEGIPGDARISVGGDVVWVAGTTWDESTGVSSTVVSRYRLAGDSMEPAGEWRSPGYLLDARRTGDRLHVVAVDQPQMGALPFDGGPVPCDEVWYPEAGADTPAATMLVTLPADGDLAPTAAAEVVGSGAGFLVTGDAAYVTTQTWPTDGSEVTTGVHRFDLASLAPTGSGVVPGTVPGPFGLSEHEGNLRVATSAQPQFVAMPVEPGPAVDIAVQPTAEAGPLAEVFVLDLDGTLDIVGRTGRFGHDGETIHGVRFVGDTAYVVTFLQTDPFWVLDLADPAAPTVVGELQIPGFSAYLHPISEDHVVGFGPDGEGRVAARLFDVSDPQGPALVDEIVLGDDTPVAWDHHAFVALDDSRFAVPVTDWPDVYEERCTPVEPQPEPEPVPLPEPEPAPETSVPPETTVPPDSTTVPDESTTTTVAPDTPVSEEPGTTVVTEPIPVDPGIGDGSGMPVPPEQRCEVITSGGRTGATVLVVDGDTLRLEDEAAVESDGNFTAERILPHADGWVLVGWDRLIDPDGGELVLPAAPNTGGPIVID